MRILGIGLLAACALLSAPAHAADLATIGCVEDKLDAATRTQLVTDVEQNLKIIGLRSSYSPGVLQAVKDAAAACVTENKWTPAAARPAILFTLAKLSLPVVQRVARDRGLDPAAIEAVWLALPEEQRNKPLTNDAYHQLADAAIPEGPNRTQANGEMLRTFFDFESIMQYASVDFAAA